MNNIRHFPSEDARYEAASEWLSRLDRELSEREREDLRAWLAADAANAAVLQKMARLWDNMDALSRLSDLFPRQALQPRRSSLPAYGIAATILLAIVFGVWTVSQRIAVEPENQQLAASMPDSYETAVGEQSTVMLSDGTVVVLNTNSRLRVAYSAEYRLLLLDRGEIHVQVAKDATRPLSLVAGTKVFQAVGTAFNVEINEDHRIELVVTEGKVRVGVRGDVEPSPNVPAVQVLDESAVTVTAGEEWILRENGEQVTPVSPEEIEVRLSWRNGHLVFRGEPLEEAMREVGRYTSVEFVILDEELKAKRVAGLFTAGDVDGLLVSLRENFNIAYERVDDKTVLLDTP